MKELLQQYKREKSQALSALKAWNKYRKTITDPAEKEAAKQKAKELELIYGQASHRVWKVRREKEWERCIDREFIVIAADLESD